MSEMENMIKTELFKNTERFIDEISLSFDYIEKQTIDNIKKYIEQIRGDPDLFKTFVKNTLLHLKGFESEMSFVLFSKQKVRSNSYSFLSNIKLFGDDLLNFNVFDNENKNTKKSLIKYIYNIYMSCSFLNVVCDDVTAELSNELNNFISRIEKEVQEEAQKVEKAVVASSSKPKRAPQVQRNPQPNLGNIGNMGNLNALAGMSGMPGMGNLFSNLMGNKEIFNIASDIAKNMNTQNINPMSMLSSLMSGNIENTPLQGLVEQIQEQVEAKINNGEINKEELEAQAQNIMESVQSADLSAIPGLSEIPGVNDILKQMGKQGKK
jgi:hypothetical protein